MAKYIDLTGKKVNKLKIIERCDPPSYLKKKEIHYRCICECGDEKIVAARTLRENRIIFCDFQKE